MSGPTENRASNAPAQPERHTRVMNLTTARKMLPLVQRIVVDIVHYQSQLESLQPRKERLDRQRRDLSWPERQHRYAMFEEITQLEHKISETLAELEQLGVAVIDLPSGRVGFPTLVNNRPAFFAWWPGEHDISQWHFASELRCRSIPPSWIEIDQVALKGAG
jgi:hypothetical protein